jgi:hypothetical protein
MHATGLDLGAEERTLSRSPQRAPRHRREPRVKYQNGSVGGHYAGGGAYFEQGLVELDDLRLESLGPALLCQGRGLHGSGVRSTSDP